MEKREIKRALHNYHWMVQMIALKRKEIDNDVGDNVIAQYGIEATLPKPQGGHTDPVYFEYLRREKEWGNVERLKKKVIFIQSRIGCIKDEKEKTVLNRILDGMSLRAISRQLGMSHTHVRSVRDQIVNQMYEFPKSAKFPKGAELQNEKSCV